MSLAPIVTDIDGVAVVGGPGWLWLPGSDLEHEALPARDTFLDSPSPHAALCPVQIGRKRSPMQRDQAHWEPSLNGAQQVSHSKQACWIYKV